MGRDAILEAGGAETGRSCLHKWVDDARSRGAAGLLAWTTGALDKGGIALCLVFGHWG